MNTTKLTVRSIQLLLFISASAVFDSIATESNFVTLSGVVSREDTSIDQSPTAWIRVYTGTVEFDSVAVYDGSFKIRIPTDIKDLSIRLDSLNPTSPQRFHPVVFDNIVINEAITLNLVVHALFSGHDRLQQTQILSGYEKALILSMDEEGKIRIDDFIDRGMVGDLSTRETIIYRYGEMLRRLTGTDPYMIERIAATLAFYNTVTGQQE